MGEYLQTLVRGRAVTLVCGSLNCQPTHCDNIPVKYNIIPQVYKQGYRMLMLLQYLEPLTVQQEHATIILELLEKMCAIEDLSSCFDAKSHAEFVRPMLLMFLQTSSGAQKSEQAAALQRSVINLRRKLTASEEYHKRVSMKMVEETQTKGFTVDAIREHLHSQYLKRDPKKRDVVKTDDDEIDPLWTAYHGSLIPLLATVNMKELLSQGEFIDRYAFLASTVSLLVQGHAIYKIEPSKKNHTVPTVDGEIARRYQSRFGESRERSGTIG